MWRVRALAGGSSYLVERPHLDHPVCYGTGVCDTKFTAGEDGRIQAMLDLTGLVYTGSNHIASAAAMDKDLSKRLFRSVDVPTPNWLMAPSTADAVERAFGWPVVV